MKNTCNKSESEILRQKAEELLKKKSEAKILELIQELAFQNEEKTKRADELLIANKELALQNEEKEKRAAELIIANKELAFQQENLKKIASRVPGVVYQYLLRPDGTSCFPYASEAIMEMFRVSPDEVREDASKVFANCHPDDLAGLIVSIQESAQNLAQWQHEYRVKFDDGTVRSLFGNAVPQKEVDRSVLWHGFITDITERKRAEDTLREIKGNYDELVRRIPVGIYKMRVHPDGKMKFHYASEKFCKMLGLEEQDVMASPASVYATIHPDDFPLMVEANRISAQTLQSFRWEGRCRIWGKMGWIRIESEPTQLPDGGFLWNGVIFDITGKKQAEMALHESERKFRDIMENVNLISANLDLNGNITFANDYFLKLTGWQREEILGRNWFDLFIPPGIELKQVLYQGIKEGILPTYYQNEILTRTGERRLIDWSNTLLRDNQGKSWGVSGIGIDITEQKKVETALMESEAKLKELNAEKDKFFSIIAHDLRNPFNALLGFTRLLVDELDTLSIKELQQIALSMRNSASNLFRLLENLLEWSRMQQGRIVFKPESTLLMPLISEIMCPVMDSANKKGIEISYEIPANMEVFADDYMLASTIRNLASNALKFTFKGGKVTIEAKAVPDNSVEISVRDTGVGMSSQMVVDLFRLDVQTNRKGTDGEPSTGLGLLLCRDFIEKHGGKIWVESEEGKGSVFFFTVPQKDPRS